MIFVFGSNEQGIHGGGAAKVARDKYGAILHQGFGPQGNSFGIPTCHVPVGRDGWEIPLDKIDFYIRAFMLYASMNKQKLYQVTQVGCGFVGLKKEDIAPLFFNAPEVCLFDTAWEPILGDTTIGGFERRYWGTY